MAEKSATAEEKYGNQSDTFRQWVNRSPCRDWFQEILFFTLISVIYGGPLWAGLYFL